MERERGKRERTSDLHQLELASVAAQAERRSERAWEKGCKQLQKQVGELQAAHANGVQENKRRVNWGKIMRLLRLSVVHKQGWRQVACYSYGLCASLHTKDTNSTPKETGTNSVIT
jgi:hypothetical protein